MMVLDTPDALAHAAAEWMLAALDRPGALAVALSGGSTPQRLYETLAQPPYRDRMPWERVHWFLGDERFVPHDDPHSNYRMVQHAMLHLAPATNIHPVPTEGLTPAEAAACYEAELQQYHNTTLDMPLFDVVLMGLGTDGHTASLFPGSPVLANRTDWAVAVTRPGGLPGVTLTYPALESCRQAAFLVAGADKRDILAQVRAGQADLPAAGYKPQGALQWFVDRAAA